MKYLQTPLPSSDLCCRLAYISQGADRNFTDLRPHTQRVLSYPCPIPVLGDLEDDVAYAAIFSLYRNGHAELCAGFPRRVSHLQHARRPDMRH